MMRAGEGIKRELRARHWNALRALFQAGESGLTALQLRQAIGGYATNTVASLCERHLIEQRGARYYLTSAGFALGDRPQSHLER